PLVPYAPHFRSLDPTPKHRVRDLIRGLARDKIVIISTHILEEVGALCSRAAIIANGRLVADDTPLALERRSRYHQAVNLVSDQALDRRSEEHTSELQSRENLVCRLLLEK